MTATRINCKDFGYGCPYPVDDIIMRQSNNNPEDDWPGTRWSEIGQGRFPVGSNSSYGNGSTGNPTHRHAHSHTHGMQNHHHLYGIHAASYYGAPAADAAHIEIGNYKTGQWQKGTRGGAASYVVNGAASASTKTVSADWFSNEGYTNTPDNNTTTGASDSNTGYETAIPPWFGVRFWKRTA